MSIVLHWQGQKLTCTVVERIDHKDFGKLAVVDCSDGVRRRIVASRLGKDADKPKGGVQLMKRVVPVETAGTQLARTQAQREYKERRLKSQRVSPAKEQALAAADKGGWVQNGGKIL